MKLISKFAVALALLFAVTSVSNASIFYGNLGIRGEDDVLSDNSLGYFVKGANATDPTKIEAGDLIRGIVRIDAVNAVNTVGDLFAVYELEVVTASATTLTATNGDVMSWLNSTATGLIDNRTLGSDANQALVLLENVGAPGASSIDFNSVAQVGDKILSSTAPGAGNAFDNWAIQLTAGLRTGDDSYTVTTDTEFAASYGNQGNDLDSLVDLAGWANNQKVADFQGFFTITGWDQSKVPYWGNVQQIPGLAQLQILNGEIFKSTGDQFDNGWAFRDVGDYYVNPIPEPSTIAIWAVVGLGAAGFVRRRQLNAKKA